MQLFSLILLVAVGGLLGTYTEVEYCIGHCLLLLYNLCVLMLVAMAMLLLAGGSSIYMG